MLTTTLVVIGHLRQPNGQSVRSPDLEIVKSTELPTQQLMNGLNNAAGAAVKKSIAQIAPNLDAAYAPVYAAIPTYADYHYSILGEYSELAASIIGSQEDIIREKLFNGLDDRLAQIPPNLEKVFRDEFSKSLDASFNANATGLSENPVGALTQKSLNDARERMHITLPVGAAAVIGGGVAAKAAATTIGKKITAKVAAKAAAKAGGKWATAGAGAATSALACAWTGPVAAACAVVGGTVVWFASDQIIIKVSEHLNREEFEANLRQMINEQKAEHAAALEDAMANFAVMVSRQNEIVGQNHDISLRELTSGGSAQVCSKAGDLRQRYDAMRNDFKMRAMQNIQALNTLLQGSENNYTLKPLVAEIHENIRAANVATISNVRVNGNFSVAYRDEVPLVGFVDIDGWKFKFDNVQASELAGFDVNLPTAFNLSFNREYNLSVAIQQHRMIWSDDFFGGNINFIVAEIVPTTGTNGEIRLQVPIAIDENAKKLDEVSTSTGHGQKINVTLAIENFYLPELTAYPRCPPN